MNPTLSFYYTASNLTIKWKKANKNTFTFEEMNAIIYMCTWCYQCTWWRVRFCSETSDPHLLLVKKKMWEIPNIGIRALFSYFTTAHNSQSSYTCPGWWFAIYIQSCRTSAQIRPWLDGSCEKLKKNGNPGNSFGQKNNSYSNINLVWVTIMLLYWGHKRNKSISFWNLSI